MHVYLLFYLLTKLFYMFMLLGVMSSQDARPLAVFECVISII